MQEWILYSKKRPSENGDYIVTTKDKDVCVLFYDNGHFIADFGFEIEAWMPLPEPYIGGLGESE